MFLPHPRVKLSIVGSLHDREVACSASDRPKFEPCVWRTVSSHSSHQPQEVFLAQFSLYVHKSGLKLDSFYFLFNKKSLAWSTIRLHRAAITDCGPFKTPLSQHPMISRFMKAVYLARPPPRKVKPIWSLSSVLGDAADMGKS